MPSLFQEIMCFDLPDSVSTSSKRRCNFKGNVIFFFNDDDDVVDNDDEGFSFGGDNDVDFCFVLVFLFDCDFACGCWGGCCTDNDFVGAGRVALVSLFSKLLILVELLLFRSGRVVEAE